MAGPVLFKAREVAEALRVSRDAVYRRIDAGEIAALRIGTGPKAHMRIPSSALADFLVRTSVQRQPAEKGTQ